MTKIDGLVRRLQGELQKAGAGYSRISIQINGPASPKRARKLLQKVTDLEPTESREWVTAGKKGYEVTVFCAEEDRKIG